jgi:uncharacterized RDD family membrane protein YckC
MVGAACSINLQVVSGDHKGQLIGRYLGYYVSTIPLLLGIIWVGIDRKKQGWHDKLARTVVVRDVEREKVQFEEQME